MQRVELMAQSHWLDSEGKGLVRQGVEGILGEIRTDIVGPFCPFFFGMIWLWSLSLQRWRVHVFQSLAASQVIDRDIGLHPLIPKPWGQMGWGAQNFLELRKVVWCTYNLFYKHFKQGLGQHPLIKNSISAAKYVNIDTKWHRKNVTASGRFCYKMSHANIFIFFRACRTLELRIRGCGPVFMGTQKKRVAGWGENSDRWLVSCWDLTSSMGMTWA